MPGVKPTDDLKSLPGKVSNQVLKQVIHDGSAWQKSIKADKQDSYQFLSRPKIPKYKQKTGERNLLIYDNQSLGQRGKQKNNGPIHLSGTDLIIATKALLCQRSKDCPKNRNVHS
jgi:putative transposase